MNVRFLTHHRQDSRVFHGLQDLKIRFSATLLLLSLTTGLLAPGVVALSHNKILSASQTEGLASDVKDFFFDVLEDALLRSVIVAQISDGSSAPSASPDRVLFTVSNTSAARESGLSSHFLSDVEPGSRLYMGAASRVLGSGSQPLGP